MKKRTVTSLSAAAIGMMLAAGSASAQNDRETEGDFFEANGMQFKISTGLDYSKGDYGQAADTEIWYAPVSIRATKDDWAFKLTVPWISIKGPGAVVGGDDGGVPSDDGVGSTVTTESGLGDIVAAATYMVDLPKDTYLDITGKVKLPTADEDRGLGTGRADYTIEADLTKEWDAFSLYGGAGYKFVGSSDTFDLNNVWMLNIGVGYELTDDLNVGLSYDWREAASSSGENPSELTAYASYMLTERVDLQFYTVAGFSDGSPDGGAGMMVGYRF